MTWNMKFASVAAAAMILGSLAVVGPPSLGNLTWTLSGPPAARLKDARYRLERLEDRMKLERDVAERAEDNARLARVRLNYIKEHDYPLGVMMEWDTTVTVGQQVAMAKQEVVRRSEAEREDLLAEIKRLEEAIRREGR